MNILFISHYYPPEMGGAAARIRGLARWLSKYGNEVSVITGFPNYPDGIVPEEYRGQIQSVESCDGVTVYRVWSYTSHMQNGISRMLNYFSFVISSTLKSLFLRGPFDVVLVSSPPLFLGISGYILSTIKKVPFVFDVRDIWPDIAVESGMFNTNNPLIRISSQLARFFYNRARKIFPVTHSKKKRIVEEIKDPQKNTIIPNGVDFDQLTSEYHNWREKLNLEGKFVVSYTGLIGIAQGIGNIISAAESLQEQENIHFLIVGDGVEKEKLVKRKDLLGLKNVTFLDSQPREKIPGIISEIDVALVPLVNAQIIDAVPSKLLEAWACKKPVILIASGESAELVNQANGGIIVDPQNPGMLAEKIKYLSEYDGTLKNLGENGYTFVKQNFDRKKIAKKLEKTLYQIVKTEK